MEKFRLHLLFVLAALLVSTGLKAQEIKATTWELKFSKSKLKAGDTVTLFFIGRIPEHQAVYATNYQCDLGPVPSKLVFKNAGDAFTVLDSAISVGEKPEYDDIFECTMKKFKGKAIIKQAIRVKLNNAEIKGELTYQSCTSSMCIQFHLMFETKGTQVLKLENPK